MSKRLFILLSVIFSLLQGTLLPVVFVEGLVVIFFLITRASSLGLPLLASGLIFDFLQNQTLGTTSLIFLTAFALTLVLKERVMLKHSLVLAAFAVAVNAARAKLLFGHIEVFPLILIFGFSFLIFSVIWRPEVSDKIKI